MFRKIQKLFCATLIVMLIVSAMAPAMAKSVSAKVSSSSARIYKKASSSSANASLKKGTKVTVKAVSGRWAKVSVKGRTGYIPKKYLSTSSSSSAKSQSSSSRYKAYISKNTYVYRSASSSSRRKSVSRNTRVYVVGRSGSYYKVQNSSGSTTGYVKASCVSRKKSSGDVARKSGSGWKSKVVKMNWFGSGKNVLRKGSYGYIYDIDTGIKLRIKRMGGHYHADVEPASTADTAKLLRVAGGHFSWASHAVILKAGNKYVACGINTMPHGDQTIKNNHYNGQFCMHMTGSITHGSSKINESHQRSIQRAYNWAH